MPQPGRFVSPPPPQRPSRLRTWWQRQNRLVKIVIGIPLLAVFLFVGSAVATGVYLGLTDQTATPTVAAIPSPTAQLAHATKPTATTIPKPTPTPEPTQPPAPTQAPAKTGLDGNPYGYDLNSSGGSLIYDPPADLCSYLPCIANFDKGRGYVEECQDGQFSKSGGIQGSCSRHGGDKQPLYAH